MAGSELPGTVGRAFPFIGRGQELASLQQDLELTGRGQGRLLLIAGEPGIGKTRLLAEFGNHTREDGWLVLRGRSYDFDGMPPYLPILEALRDLIRSSPDEEVEELLKSAPPIAALLPELRDRIAEPSTAHPPDLERLRLFDAVCECFLHTAASPRHQGVLLGLDDLHWFDRSSLQLLLHLARKLSDSRLMVVGTYRAEAAGPSTPFSETLATLTRERLDTRVALGSFSKAETAALVANVSGVNPAEAIVRDLHDRTKGNPLFIEEVVRHLLSERWDLTSRSISSPGWQIPPGLQEIIQQRLSRLTPDSLRVLQAASVIGETFSVRYLRRVCELGDEALIGGLEELAQAGVLREEDARYVFSHPLVREVVYSGISLARRQQLHTRAAEALQASATGRSGPDLALIGQHWRLSGDPERAVECLLRAGEAALSLTAWSEAASHWQTAVECMEQAGYPPQRRARLLEGIGDLYFVSTLEAKRAVAHYERAIALYEAEGDAGATARAHLKAGRGLAYPTTEFDAQGALEHLQAAHGFLTGGQVNFELGELYFALGHMETHALRTSPAELIRAMEQLEVIAEKLDNGFLRVAATSLQGHFLAQQGRLREGLALEARACEEAAALAASAPKLWPDDWRDMLQVSDTASEGQPLESAGIAKYFFSYLRPFTLNCCGLQSFDLGDPSTARASHERIQDAQGRYMSPFLMFDLFLAGDVAALRQCNDPQAQLLSPLGMAKDYAPFMLGWCEGRWQETNSELERFASRVRSVGSDSLMIFVERFVTRFCRVNGDVTSRRAALEERLAAATRCGAVKLEVPIRTEIALIDAEGGSPDKAAAHLARCREVLAAGEDWRGIAGRIALAEAVLAAAQRRNEDAESLFERAVEIFQRFSLPWDEAEAYELWTRAGARFLRGRNRRAFVAEKLAAARSIYERIGAGQPWVDRLQELERRGSNGAAASAGDLPEGLSARQAQVLRLIAEGKTNGEIADELVISLRTVERHVAELYAKIGARNRVEAAAFAMNHLARA